MQKKNKKKVLNETSPFTEKPSLLQENTLTKETATSLSQKKKKNGTKNHFLKKKKSSQKTFEKIFETIPLFLLCSVVSSEKNFLFKKKRNL